jgi:hypothetical protein
MHWESFDLRIDFPRLRVPTSLPCTFDSVADAHGLLVAKILEDELAEAGVGVVL